MILQNHALVKRNILLQLAAVAHDHIVGDIHILPQRAVFADTAAGLQMAEMPYLRALANDHVVIHIAAGMNEIPPLLFHACFPLAYAGFIVERRRRLGNGGAVWFLRKGNGCRTSKSSPSSRETEARGKRRPSAICLGEQKKPHAVTHVAPP